MLEYPRSDQLLELGYLTLGAVIFAAGVVALLITILRSERRDLSLVFFGCLSVLVSLRFIICTKAVRSVLGGSSDFWDTGQTTLNYLLAATTFAFVRSHIGRGWRSSLHWVIWSYIVFACAALASALISPTRGFFEIANNLAIVLVLATIFAHAVRSESRNVRSDQIIAVCSMAGIMFFTVESLESMNLVSLEFHTRYARLTILHCVGVALVLVVRYLLVREERLLVVGQELRTARQIQDSILPQTLPKIPGLDISRRYEPMTEVAGDFYDFTTIGGKGLGILVADVSGHGVPAALIASMVKVAFLSQTDQASRPARVLAGMNQVFGGRLQEQFVTAGYAFIDMEKGRLHYSGAAHPSLLLQQANGNDIVCLDNNGLMLGPFPGATYETVSRDLAPGDRIVMYTDGLTEAANSEEMQYGDERLRQFLTASSEMTAEEFADDLMHEVISWSGGRIGDDLTLVVVDILEPDPPLGL